jgi:hypothetical protein
MMNPRGGTGSPGGVSEGRISRRRLLAAGGVVALGSLAGCLNRVAASGTNTVASPAAVFAGSGSLDDGSDSDIDQVFGGPRVSRLTPSVNGDLGFLSSEVELEGWVTAASVSAVNYNNSRSNRSGIRGPATDGDSDADGVDDGTSRLDENPDITRSNRSTLRVSDVLDDELDGDDEILQVVSRLDERLRSETLAAWESISKRSARTGRSPELDSEVSAGLEAMAETLAELRTALERCSDDVCVLALANVAGREDDLRRAREHAENGEWAAFGGVNGGTGDDILLGDYLLPSPSFDPSGSFTAGERADLFRYFDGAALIGERFTVSLPDAELPGGAGDVASAVTPRACVDYLTGRAEADGQVFSWGDHDGDGFGDCVETGRGGKDGTVCGTSEHFLAALSGPVETGGRIETARTSDGSVVVSNSPPTDGSGQSVRWAAYRTGEEELPVGLGRWGSESGPARETATLVSQVLAQPPECPHPLPALLYLKRCRSGDQLIYTGGWMVDDAALYSDAATLLVLAGETVIVPVCFDRCEGPPDVLSLDSDGDGLPAELLDRFSGDPRLGGAQIAVGTLRGLTEAGVLSEELREAADPLPREGTGREDDDDDDDKKKKRKIKITYAPIFHFISGPSTTDDEKFKAGAELSQTVN